MLSPDAATRPGHDRYLAVESSHVGPPLLSLGTIGEERSPHGPMSSWPVRHSRRCRARHRSFGHGDTYFEWRFQDLVDDSVVAAVSRWRLLVRVKRMIMMVTYFTTPG